MKRTLSKVKKFIKKILPESIILFYHHIVARVAAFFYGYPSKKMIVIGITGTKGKTSTANFIWSCLTAGGYKTGIISTANIRIGHEESLNAYNMTMPGRFITQKLIHKMSQEGCQYCVIESTSQGIKQHRHTGISYDILVFTNLTPEHLESHERSFEKYKRTKGKIFEDISRKPHKIISGNKIEKIIIANDDSPHSEYFLQFDADKKITYGTSQKSHLTAENIQTTPYGSIFEVDTSPFEISIKGVFNVSNALPAIAVGRLVGVKDDIIAKGIRSLNRIPGRMEEIDMGQNFTVLVDYAHEGESMSKLLNAARGMRSDNKKIIILVSASGGGRDKAKRPAMGSLAGELADVVVVSSADPYEENPWQILEDIASASEEKGKIRGKDLFLEVDRREGIRKALSLAKEGDIVLISGKGAEQSIVVDEMRQPWDDREVVREELEKL